MQFKIRALLIMCLSLIITQVHGSASTVDTTAKNKSILLKSLPGNNITGTFVAYFKDGLELIKADSLDKGLTLLSKGIEQLNAEQQIRRIQSYQNLEIFDLLNEMANRKLSKPEKTLGQMFMKTLFTTTEGPTEKNLAPYLKQAPQTLFSHRVKLLLLSGYRNNSAEKELNWILTNAPATPSANILKAEIAYDNENYKEAIRYATNTIALLPKYAYAYHLKAKSHSAAKEYDKAIAGYDEAIKLFANQPVYHYDRADALLDMEKYEDAITGFKKVIMLSFKWSYYNVARCYHHLNRPDSALYYINEHIKLNPYDEDGYDIKGDIYSDVKDYKMAVNCYTQAIQYNDKALHIYEDRADAYYADEQYDEAIADYTKSIGNKRNGAYALDCIANCYIKKGDYIKANDYFKLALKAKPEYKYSYWGINLVQNRLGNYKEAIEAARHAVAIDSTYDSALGNLGWTYYCAGDYQACITYSYKALAYNKKATYAMFNIALATLHLGNFERSKQLYRQFIKECKSNNYPISNGAIDDLKDLIKKQIYVKEARYIIENVFENGTAG